MFLIRAIAPRLRKIPYFLRPCVEHLEYRILFSATRLPTSYGVTDLGTLGGPNSTPVALNNLGQVVGISNTSTQNGGQEAFIYSSNTGMVAIPGFPGNNGISAAGINDLGQVVGEGFIYTGPANGQGAHHAFIYSAATGLVDIGIPPGRADSYATAINDNGQVAAYSDSNVGNVGFTYSVSTGITDSAYGAFTAINANGDVTTTASTSSSSSSFIYSFDASHSTPLPSLPGFAFTSATAINDSDEVAGTASNISTFGDNHAFLYVPKSGITDLGTLNNPVSDSISSALGINNSGIVVGTSQFGEPSFITDAFAYTPADGMVDLNTLIPFSHWQLTSTVAINNAGQIVCDAINPQLDDAQHAILLTPQPAADHQSYVQQLYNDILKRPPDPVGLTYWTNMLNQGGTDAQLSVSLTSSREYDANIVDSFYTSYLGRHADPSGLNAWVNQMQAGLNAETIRAGILGSPEYYSDTGGTDTTFINALYSQFLSRPADSIGLAYWLDQLKTKSTRTIAASISNSDENRTDIVNALYENYLDRAADPSGLAYWKSQLANNVSQPQIVTFFVTSGEYLTLHNLSLS